MTLRPAPLQADRNGGREGRLRLDNAASGIVLRAAIGRAGFVAAGRKREGDGATPAGGQWRGPVRLAVLGIAYRADRLPAPRTTPSLPRHAIHAHDGWCDAPEAARYNGAVHTPAASSPVQPSAEKMMREDGLYDLVLVLDWNMGPHCGRSARIRHRGSAIFWHCARKAHGRLQPTAGCVALPRLDLQKLLPRIGPRTRITILA